VGGSPGSFHPGEAGTRPGDGRESHRPPGGRSGYLPPEFVPHRASFHQDEPDDYDEEPRDHVGFDSLAEQNPPDGGDRDRERVTDGIDLDGPMRSSSRR
jgi:hypothetical protein